MSGRFLARFSLLLSFFVLLTALVASPASAAGQTMTAQMPAVETFHFKVSLKWSAVPGASYYEVRYTNHPKNMLTNSGLFTMTAGTQIYSPMNSSLGYRFFRVYAFNSAGALLAFSNSVGVAKYPSGLVVRMKKDVALTNSYPDPNRSYVPAQYQRPTWFVTISPTVLNSYVAPNFRMSEFILQPGVTAALVDPNLVQHVQDARNRYGVMWIESGYRTPWYNASVGGSKYSRHMYGDGVDVRARTQAQWNTLNAIFAAERPAYVESYAEGGRHHWHGDWRSEGKGYRNW